MTRKARATNRAARAVAMRGPARRFYLFSGLSSEKRASGALLAGGKGKTVVAGARIPAAILKSHLHVTAAAFVDEWHRSMIGHVRAHAVGFNAQYANGLAALVMPCGQECAELGK